ncbi:alpha/beta hydrolase [Streptomyces sp. NPDC050560]|uniref:alpha/beta hydrolase n=1 Tax=Streptomyces sp. NPDC050560 TaxID=3365630 RepID=UPI0037B53694
MSVVRAGGDGRTEADGTGRAGLRTLLRAADGVRIDVAYRPGPGGREGRGGPDVIVVAHGFTGDLDRPHIRRIAAGFARRAAVVTFTFRGHGRSGGRSTVGDREVLDLAAAVAWARSLGHRRVATVGFSMGGSVVLRHAALHGGGDPDTDAGRTARTRTDAVVSVSGPARWFYRGTAPMRRVHWLVTRPAGRVVGRYGLRTRIHDKDWDPVPLSPVQAVPLIAPTPLLIVHGDRDPYFPLDHPRMLATAGAGAADLWLEQGMGHAEHATTDALVARIGEWLEKRG